MTTARLGRQLLSSSTRASRAVRSTSRRLMSADAASHEFKPKSDLPWIVGAAAVSIPSLFYLLQETSAIKARIAAGHHDAHGHDSHEHAAKEHEEHASPVVMKDDEGTSADVTQSVQAAEEADVPPAAETNNEPAEDAASAPEPPKDKKSD
ncbi:Ubiquitin-conjugating enzyme [Mycena kentingensis (nom. inval.)]|nr:Ubiquitin-conjugating enzyme [Mycena kentingensis (nom. inval.)]